MRNFGSAAADEPSAAASMSKTAVAEMLNWLWFCWGLSVIGGDFLVLDIFVFLIRGGSNGLGC